MLMPSAVFDNIFVRSGDLAPKSGFYIYKGNPVKGVLPCIPTDAEKVISLKKGDVVPVIDSCRRHEAVYRLTITTD